MRTIDARLGGVGDVAVGLWIAEGARAAGERVAIVAGSHAEVVRAFGHELADGPSDDCLPLGTDSSPYQAEIRTANADRSPRAVRWQRTVGWGFPVLRPALSPLPDETADWARDMMDGRPTVVIAPRASYSTRSLPLQKWLRVAWALSAQGVRTLAIDGDRDAVKDFPLFAFGYGWPHVLALLERAVLVAGNDSGVAHLATTVGVPTVAVLGPTDPVVVFGHCLDVLTPVRDRTMPCVGCHFSGSGGYQAACDLGCEALDVLPWTAVRDAVLHALASRPPCQIWPAPGC